MSTLNSIPLDYDTPRFPALYWPFHTEINEPKYLYTVHDIWKFTLYWTLITIPLAHLIVALWAVFMQFLSAKGRAKYLKTHSRVAPTRRRSESTGFAFSSGMGRKKSGPRSGDDESGTDTDEHGREGDDEHVQQYAGDSGQSSSQRSSMPSSPSSVGPRRRSQGVKKLSSKNKKLLGASPFQSTVKFAGLIVGLYVVIGAIEAMIAGSLVGLVLGAVYNAGYFRMSVWTPLFWGIINMLVLILASFRISGGM